MPPPPPSPAPLSPSNSFLLSPFSKLHSHQSFPFKFALHLLLLFLVTAQVLVYNFQDALYSRTMHKGFKSAFMPPTFTITDNPDTTTLFELDSTLVSLQDVLKAFYTLPYTSVAGIGYLDDRPGTSTSNPNYYERCHTGNATFTFLANSTMKYPTLSIYSHVSPSDELRPGFIISEYTLYNNTDIGDLVPSLNSTDSLRTLTDDLDHMTFDMSLCNYNIGYFYRSCYEWSVKTHYDFGNFANIDVSVDAHIVGKCDAMDLNEYVSKFVHNLGIAAVAAVYFALLVKDVARRIHGYGEARLAHAIAHKIVKSVKEEAKNEERKKSRDANRAEASSRQEIIPPGSPSHDGYDSGYDSSTSSTAERIDKNLINLQFNGKDGEMVKFVVEMEWSEVTWSIWIRFFPLWLPVTAIGILITIEYSLRLAFTKNYHIPTTAPEKLSCGASCILLWLTAMQFFKHNRNYYNFVLTLEQAAPVLAPFVAGVMPVFVGYALFGVAYFGFRVELFSLPSDSLQQLFSMMNGDVLYNAFHELWTPNVVVVYVYLYSFIFVFIYLVLNVAISVIEHSYFSSAGRVRTFDLFIARGMGFNVKRDEWGVGKAGEIEEPEAIVNPNLFLQEVEEQVGEVVKGEEGGGARGSPRGAQSPRGSWSGVGARSPRGSWTGAGGEEAFINAVMKGCDEGVLSNHDQFVLQDIMRQELADLALYK